MSRKLSTQDYPEHLNPFDENYNGQAIPEPSNSRQKYNTWSATRPNQVSTLARPKEKSTLLEKPWAALNISPKGKIVRRLSIMKTAVEKFASKKKRLSHSEETGLPPRSQSFHDEFNFKIISPKLKEKIRQQAFNTPVTRIEPEVTLSTAETSDATRTLQLSRLSLPLKTEANDSAGVEDGTPTSPESVKDLSFPGIRPKPRKKRPPPPPPTETVKSPSLELPNGKDKNEDNYSVNSSITQDLEKDASSEEENSLTELDQQRVKLQP